MNTSGISANVISCEAHSMVGVALKVSELISMPEIETAASSLNLRPAATPEVPVNSMPPFTDEAPLIFIFLPTPADSSSKPLKSNLSILQFRVNLVVTY